MRLVSRTSLALVWAVLVGAITVLAVNLALRVAATSADRVPGLRMPLVVSWKTVLLLLLLVVAVVAWGPAVRLCERIGLGRRRMAGAAAAVAAVVVASLGALVGGGAVGASPAFDRWGFHHGVPAGQRLEFDPYNGETPLVEVVTNTSAFRDDEWTIPAPDDGVRRVLVVGDSTVFGLSLRRKADLLDTRLEERLAAAGVGRWDVWNVGKAPSGLWYFSEAIRRIAPDARASDAIMFLHCANDVDFVDIQAALADRPSWFHVLADHAGLFSDLLRVGPRAWPFEVRGSPEAERVNLAAFERLLASAARTGLRVIVFEADRRCPALDPYRGRPGVVFTDLLPSGAACDESSGACGLYIDPSLGYARTGHLTAKGSAAVAERLAEILLSGAGGKGAD